jgi:arsenate reductase
MKKPNLIFLCTHNQARSQMAEAFLKKYAGDFFNIFSAGFEKRKIHPLTIKVMEEKGFDLSKHYSKELKQFLGEKHFGIVITMCQKAEQLCPIIPGVSTRLYWEIEDPVAIDGSEEEPLEKFREIRDLIEEKIKSWLKERGIL